MASRDAEDTPGRSRAGALAGARRVAVLRLDNAGDVILAGPVFRALRAALPRAKLLLVASPHGAAAAELLPWVDEVLVWRAVWQDAAGAMPFDPARESEAIDQLRAVGADAAIILTSFSQTPFAAGYACYLAGIPIRVGHAELFGGGVLSHPIPGPAPDHQAERDIHLLRGVGVVPAGDQLEARVPALVGAEVASRLREAGIPDGEPIVVAPGATCSARRYDPAAFGLAAAGLRSRIGRPIVILGGASERQLGEAVVASVPDAIDFVGETSLAEAAGIVASAGLVLTNNTLAMHLAEAFLRPVVVAYAGTDRESEWAPRRTAHVLLHEPTVCAPCRLFDCPFVGHPCLDIAPARMTAAGLDLLGASAGGDSLSAGVKRQSPVDVPIPRS